MRWVHSTINLYEPIDSSALLKKIEFAGRTCYRSFDRMSDNIAGTETFIANAIKRGHESILEHVSITFQVICSRDVLAQWTRHRIASYSVESQRYCNYTKDKYAGLVFIMPEGVTDEMAAAIEEAMRQDEVYYNRLIEMGAKPEQARAVLGNCTKTEFIWTANIREIRHFIKLRTAPGAQPDIVKLATQLKNLLIENNLSVLVNDL